MSLAMTALGDLCATTIPGGDSDKVNDVLWITCHPLRLRPERNRPAGRRWQMLLPSVPVGRPAASVATPAGRAPPAAAAPAATQSNQNRDVRQLKSLLGDYKRMLMMRSDVKYHETNYVIRYDKNDHDTHG